MSFIQIAPKVSSSTPTAYYDDLRFRLHGDGERVVRCNADEVETTCETAAAACPDAGTYFDYASSGCKACASNCQTCAKYGGACEACKPGLVLQRETGTCVSYDEFCPDADTWYDPEDHACRSCAENGCKGCSKSNGACTSCTRLRQLKNDKCWLCRST